MDSRSKYNDLSLIYSYKAKEMMIKELISRKQETGSMTIKAELREQITEARHEMDVIKAKLILELEASTMTLDELTGDMEASDGFDDILTRQVYLMERKIERITNTLSV